MGLNLYFIKFSLRNWTYFVHAAKKILFEKRIPFHKHIFNFKKSGKIAAQQISLINNNLK